MEVLAGLVPGDPSLSVLQTLYPHEALLPREWRERGDASLVSFIFLLDQGHTLITSFNPN